HQREDGMQTVSYHSPCRNICSSSTWITEDFRLEQNYPNPFNPSTNIQFSLPSQETINLSIYDVHGRLVSTLIDGQTYSPGNYRVNWDGVNNLGEKVASGVYFAKIEAGNFAKSIKMSLIK
ncbi:MAG: T9SS type A sorting domain-containing protein, partial [Candidatus Kryptoniota bacterium]